MIKELCMFFNVKSPLIHSPVPKSKTVTGRFYNKAVLDITEVNAHKQVGATLTLT